jgi:uncharacterized surface anchored protein
MTSRSSFSAKALSKADLATLVTQNIRTTAKQRNRSENCNHRQSSDTISGQTKVVIRLQFEAMYDTKATMQLPDIHKSESQFSKVKRKLLVSF